MYVMYVCLYVYMYVMYVCMYIYTLRGTAEPNLKFSNLNNIVVNFDTI